MLCEMLQEDEKVSVVIHPEGCAAPMQPVGPSCMKWSLYIVCRELLLFAIDLIRLI